MISTSDGVVDIEKQERIKAWHRFYYRYIAPRFRNRRMALFSRVLSVNDTTRIVDLGGAESTWERINAEPQVTMINTQGTPYKNGRFTFIIGDACSVNVTDDSFDVAFSNSVIEHVGNFSRQKEFADTVRRIAPRYFVQTPYRYFPIEPHFMCLGIQFLPKPIFKKIVRWLTLWGLTVKPNQAEIDALVDEIRLLTVREMRELFPDAQIVKERFLLFTKSIIAIRTAPKSDSTSRATN
jgi:Methyltransferase domain